MEPDTSLKRTGPGLQSRKPASWQKQSLIAGGFLGGSYILYEIWFDKYQDVSLSVYSSGYRIMIEYSHVATVS